jgi:hypothetical protein
MKAILKLFLVTMIAVTGTQPLHADLRYQATKSAISTTVGAGLAALIAYYFSQNPKMSAAIGGMLGLALSAYQSPYTPSLEEKGQTCENVFLLDGELIVITNLDKSTCATKLAGYERLITDLKTAKSNGEKTFTQLPISGIIISTANFQLTLELMKNKQNEMPQGFNPSSLSRRPALPLSAPSAPRGNYAPSSGIYPALVAPPQSGSPHVQWRSSRSPDNI